MIWIPVLLMVEIGTAEIGALMAGLVVFTASAKAVPFIGNMPALIPTTVNPTTPNFNTLKGLFFIVCSRSISL
ncbi:hypothetical protein D3C76_1654820 [compost metagenome]